MFDWLKTWMTNVAAGRGTWTRGKRVEAAFERPIRERFTLALLRGGRVWMWTQHQGVVPLSGGTCVLLRKGCHYHAEQDPENPGQWTWVSFDILNARKRLVPAAGTALPETFACPDSLLFDATVRRMIELCRRGGSSVQTAVHLLRTLLLDLEQAWASMGAVSLDRRHAGLHEKMNLAAMNLRDALTDPPSTAQLARRSGCSREHFCRQFRRVFGCGPHAYLIAARLDLARELLATTDLPIKVVAASSGYPDPYSFSKQFRQHTGVTPTQFRAARG